MILIPLGAQQPFNERNERDKAVDWIKRNNKWGIDHPIVKDMTSLIDEQTNDGNNINLFFGKGLLKKGTFQSIHLWSGQFFHFELSNGQAKTMELGPMGVQSTNGQRVDKRNPTPLFQISELKLKDIPGARVAGDQKLTGTLSIRSAEQMILGGSYAIRLGFRATAAVTKYFYLNNVKLIRDATTVEFNYGPINDNSDIVPYFGVLPAFFDICTVKQSGFKHDIQLLSNSLALLLDVKGQR